MPARLLVFNDQFYPAYKAGGPVQSLTNLVAEIDDFAKSSVLTSAFDLNSTVPLEKIEPNTWNKTAIKDQKVVDVWYDNGSSDLRFVLTAAAPDLVYLNGMFSYRFMIKPLLLCRRLRKPIKVVICPRGMLQKGALLGKPLKKKFYLSLLRASGLLKDVRWHATNEEEKEDIKRYFGQGATVVIAPNIPKRPVAEPAPLMKEAKQLNLVYISLITEKKNLLQLIELLNRSREGVTLDIYGPVKDGRYWAECQKLIAQSNRRITYKGDVKPHDVQAVFGTYHASVILTKGENFGHALYESLSAGRPLITSHFTPWNNLEEKMAGWNLDIHDRDACLRVMEKIAGMDNDEYQGFCVGAHRLAGDYYCNLNAKEKYKALFTIN